MQEREISAQWEYNNHQCVCIILLSHMCIQIKMQVGATLGRPSRPKATMGFFFRWTSDTRLIIGTGLRQVYDSNSNNGIEQFHKILSLKLQCLTAASCVVYKVTKVSHRELN